MCRHSVQVGHSAKTWATVRGTKQSIQYGGCDASIRCLCVSLVCPILNRHKMISVRRDRLLEETQGVGASLIVRNLFLMGTSDHSETHLLRTVFQLLGKSLYMEEGVVLLGQAPLQLLAPHRPPAHYPQPHSGPVPSISECSCSWWTSEQASARLPKQLGGNC